MNAKRNLITQTLLFIICSIFAQNSDSSSKVESINDIPSYITFSSDNARMKQETGLEKILNLKDGITALETNTLIDKAGGKHVSYQEFYKK